MTPTPESQQSALYATMRDELPTYGTIPWAELIAAIGAARGCEWTPDGAHYIGHQSTGVNNMNSLNRIVTYFVERALEESRTPASVDHAALAEEIADAIYSGGDYGTSGQKAWRLRKTAVEMTDCLHIAQRAIQAALRAHPAGGVSACPLGLDALSADAEWLRHLGNDLYAKGHLDRHEAEEIGRVADRHIRAHPATNGNLSEERLMELCCIYDANLPGGYSGRAIPHALNMALRAAGIGAGVVDTRSPEEKTRDILSAYHDEEIGVELRAALTSDIARAIRVASEGRKL